MLMTLCKEVVTKFRSNYEVPACITVVHAKHHVAFVFIPESSRSSFSFLFLVFRFLLSAVQPIEFCGGSTLASL